MDPYSKLQQLHQSMQKMTEAIAALEDDILNTLKENTELKVENQFLREKLDKNKNQNQSTKSQSGLESLKKIYDSGYHICNMYYGTHRDLNSDCMFCLNILDNFKDQKAKENSSEKTR